MSRSRRPATALAALATCLVGAVIGLPLLALGAGAIDDPTNSCLGARVPGATPIEGAATLTAPARRPPTRPPERAPTSTPSRNTPPATTPPWPPPTSPPPPAPAPTPG